MTSTVPMVRASGVAKSYGSHQVLTDISLEVASGEVLCIIGPSGSGKSTFLRCINHLEKVDGGRLEVDGHLVGYREKGGVLHEISAKDAASQRRDIGMVFQRFNLFPHLTVLENVIEAPRRVRKQPVARRRNVLALCSTGSASPTRSTRTRGTSRAGSSSASPSLAPWPWTPS